jgi:hypothetical protein
MSFGNRGEAVTTTTSIHVQLGTAFWILLTVLIVGGVMWVKLGSDKMGKVISEGGGVI